jgi:LCP family protein required for cell wall assembly
MSLLAALALLGGLIWLGGKIVRTRQNIAAMIVTAAPASAQEQAGALAGRLAAVPPLLAPRRAGAVNSAAVGALVPSATPQMPDALGVATPAGAPTHWPTLEAPSMPSTTAAPPTPVPPTALIPTPTAAVPDTAITVLLLGSDRRPGERGMSRTDAVMLAHIDPARERVALLSLPRDLWVSIPGYGANRINAAYTWGETYGAIGGGMGLARETLGNLLGVPVDYVVLIDFEGFVGAIDSIGGVTVRVEKELYDAHFPTMDYGYQELRFRPGPQRMDGQTALNYSRIRHPDSDFARIRRQQAVLVALGERLRERGDLRNLLSADAITGALRNYVRTDMPQERMLELAWALRSLGANQVERYTLNESMVTFGVGRERYAQRPRPGALQTLVRRWRGVR